MKNRIASILFMVFGGFNFQSQAQVNIDPNVNWQLFLPNLLGSQCAEISNVQFSGNLSSFSYYSSPNNYLGLSRGILMTTGATNFDQPNTVENFGIDNGAQINLPTPLLNYINSTSGMPSAQLFNTSFIQFDFKTTSPDTVWLKYIFASEEYPEWVGTQYNDLFGFLIFPADGSQDPFNFSTVPQTNAPVCVNNINNGSANIGPCSFCQYYIDNTPGQFLEFDGFTTMLTAKYFVPQAGVKYRIVLFISDLGDAIYDSGVFLEITTGNQNVAGNVTCDGLPASNCLVEYYAYNWDNALAPLAASTFTDNTGFYEIQNIPFGGYIVRTVPDTNICPGHFPMYYDSVIVWNDATIITNPCSTDTLSILAAPLVNNAGLCSLSGTIFTSESLSDIPVGLGNVPILLIEKTLGAVGFAKSDINGNYTFTKFGAGEYIIYPDIPGLNVINPIQFQASVSNEIKFADYIVLPDKILSINDYLKSSNISQNTSVLVYPNPSSGDINLLYKHQSKSSSLSYSVFNSSGILIYNGLINDIPVFGKNVQLNFNNLMNGLYYIKVADADGFQSVEKFTILK